MAEMVDSCCVSSTMAVQLTKPDKNNNTTANVDDGINLPSEQCDLIEDGTDEKSESTGDSDERRLSSGGGDDDENNDNAANDTVITETTTVALSSSSSSSNDGTEVPMTNESTSNKTTTSTQNLPATDPYKDFSGVDTESFIGTTLRNNPKDRTLLLTLETLIQQFIQNDEQTSHQFQAMNSYERMIVHRVAAFFGLDHNVDKNGQAVVVTKTPNTRIPSFSFQKCIPEDESTDTTNGASSAETALSSVNPSELPTRRILRRHEKTTHHDHFQRNGLHEDYPNQQTSSTNKNQPSSKPYLERVNNYAETRARIFNDNTDLSNASVSNKNTKTNQKPHSNFVRPSYRKQQQQHQHQQHQNSLHQHRPYAYQHSQQTTNNHMQQYPAGKTIDPSSHMLNTSTSRGPSIYSGQQPPTGNLGIAPSSMYASMVASNPNAGPLRPPGATSFYSPLQQPSIEYDYKQQSGGPHIYNYIPMIPPTTSNFIHQQQQPTQQLHPQVPSSGGPNGPNQVPSQQGAGIPLPILVHQQPTGQIQYIFPAHHLQQQQQQQPQPPTNSYPITSDGQYVQLYRQDSLSIPGQSTVPLPPPSVVDSNNTHHHSYSQNQSYHHHSISQQQQQQPPPPPQQLPPSQSNPAPQPPPFVRIYPSGTPGNVPHHPFAQATYQQQPPPPPQTAFVQSGNIPGSSYIISPPQNVGGVQAYPAFDNGVPYNNYGPNTTAGKATVNNNAASVQYATNHLASLNVQGQHDDYQARLMNNPQTRFSHSNGSANNNQQRNFMGRPLVQSPNGPTGTPRMTIYSSANQPYRPTRPLHTSNTDKQVSSLENDPKSLAATQQPNNSDNLSLAGPAQE